MNDDRWTLNGWTCRHDGLYSNKLNQLNVFLTISKVIFRSFFFFFTARFFSFLVLLLFSAPFSGLSNTVCHLNCLLLFFIYDQINNSNSDSNGKNLFDKFVLHLINLVHTRPHTVRNTKKLRNDTSGVTINNNEIWYYRFGITDFINRRNLWKYRTKIFTGKRK